MSHFTVLAAAQLPGEITEQLKLLPELEITRRIIWTAYINSLRSGKASPELPPVNDQMRMELLAEHLVEPLLAPYDENTVDPQYRKFADCTEDCRKEYEGSIDCVRMPDVRILPTYHWDFSNQVELYAGKVYQRKAGQLHHRVRTKKAKKYIALQNYPYYRKMYSSFEQFAEQYYCFIRDEETGTYGFYCNPDAQWDWYQIGGRWLYRFLVPQDCPIVVCGERSFLLKDSTEPDAPEGYRWVAGARKCDVAWDMMKAVRLEQSTNKWQKLNEWYQAGKLPKDAHAARITDEGIKSWGYLIYRKDESLEEYLLREGLSERFRYPFSTFAYLDGNGWVGRGNMGWFGISYDKEDTHVWNQKLEDFIAGLPDETLLVSVDCHI